MRLLNTSTIQFVNIPDFAVDKSDTYYAILSHRWRQEEVSYEEIRDGQDVSEKRGYAKIRNACVVARELGYELIWLDTCCIDQTNNNELTTAINSMYRWYASSSVCIAYLDDVSSADDFVRSEWFDRGWTLQELIAPKEVLFYDSQWEAIGDKRDLGDLITRITAVPAEVLQNRISLRSCSIAQRMSWAAGRQTERIEDIAYCLLGIFDIHMPLIYGERERAFFRLQQEIIKISTDESIFAWKSIGSASHSGHPPYLYVSPFAPAPSCFAGCGKVMAFGDTTGFAIDQFGLSATFHAMLAAPGIYKVRLQAGVLHKSGRVWCAVYLARIPNSTSYIRIIENPGSNGVTTYNLQSWYLAPVKAVRFQVKLQAPEKLRDAPCLFSQLFRHCKFESYVYKANSTDFGYTDLSRNLQMLDRQREPTNAWSYPNHANDTSDARIWLKVIFNYSSQERCLYGCRDWDGLMLGCFAGSLEPTCVLLKSKGQSPMMYNPIERIAIGGRREEADRAAASWNEWIQSWSNDYYEISCFSQDYHHNELSTVYRNKYLNDDHKWRLLVRMKLVEDVESITHEATARSSNVIFYSTVGFSVEIVQTRDVPAVSNSGITTRLLRWWSET